MTIIKMYDKETYEKLNNISKIVFGKEFKYLYDEKAEKMMIKLIRYGKEYRKKELIDEL